LTRLAQPNALDGINNTLALLQNAVLQVAEQQRQLAAVIKQEVLSHVLSRLDEIEKGTK
jgi:hypothetical protein